MFRRKYSRGMIYQIKMIRKNFVKNRKGDIPITVLVIGVFGVCALAMLTFLISDFSIGNSFVGIGIMQQLNSNVDEYLFYENVGVPQESLDLMFNYIEEDSIKYFYEEKTYTPFSLFGEPEEVLLFSVQYPVPN